MNLPTRSGLAAGALLVAFVFGSSFAALAQSSTAPAGEAIADPVLIENTVAKIRRSDYERELMRLPANVRGGFPTNAGRVNELLRRMLLTRTLAEQARVAGIDQDPETKARIASEIERYLAQLRVQQVEAAAMAEFDASSAKFEARAKELYVVDREKYASPEQMRASHILFDLKRHPKEEGQRLARELRSRIVAGEDFNEAARRVSEDPSAAVNAGRIDWFGREEMDPAFAAAVFALARDGEVSEPVLSQFGWHLIRREGYRPAGPRPYEEVRADILEQLKRKHVDDRRTEFLAKVAGDPATRTHDPAIGELIVRRPDPSIVRKVIEGVVSKDGTVAPLKP